MEKFLNYLEIIDFFHTGFIQPHFIQNCGGDLGVSPTPSTPPNNKILTGVN
ncbi:MAG: hypothetical protein ACE5ES_00985 [Candidatus Nanoarchaeia archaeon]